MAHGEVRAVNTARVAEALADARSSGDALRLVSGGAWLDANRPVRASSRLELAENRGITAYEPGDLTITARAGTTLREVADTVGAARQWLPLDPYGTDHATVGAIVATGSSGPLATGYGTPRDMTLGCEFVSGSGLVVQAGGRVVKNVAGFDLVRLVTGSWGSLGAITEVTLRLRALPQRDVTIALPLDAGAGAAGIRSLAPLPAAAELLSPRLSERLGFGGVEVLLVRLTGSELAVNAQRSALAALGGAARDEEVDRWAALRAADDHAAAIVRISTLPSELPRTWKLACALTASFTGAWCSAQPVRGVVRLVFPKPGEGDLQWERDLAARLAALTSERMRAIFERLPAALWTTLAPSALGDGLSRGIKERFDPGSILNPGIWGEPA
ncbi:MAG: linked oxidase protein [Gemmatimonadetes bacterium]|nr:linked oxidase protein [Gemmatimonadota bacterium]